MIVASAVNTTPRTTQNVHMGGKKEIRRPVAQEKSRARSAQTVAAKGGRTGMSA
jgi:hypothetical protein